MIAIQDISIKSFNSNKWIVNTPSGNHILINEHSKRLLEILQSTESVPEALTVFNATYNKSFKLEEFELLIEKTFGELDILKSETDKAFKKKSYMNFKLPLLSRQLAALLASPFRLLYSPGLFWVLLPMVFLANVLLTSQNISFDISQFNAGNVMIYTCCFYFSMLIHELGHIAACRKFDINHGEIGFGIYFIFPVVYADVSDIWNANRNQRTITNLGGIYLELLYALLFGLIFLFSREQVYLYVLASITIKAITEMNPFIRYDGYWIISDLTNTPNLMLRSRQAFKSLIFRRSSKNTARNWKFYLLASYGLFNTALMIFYLLWVIIVFHEEIIGFPQFILDSVRASLAFELSALLESIGFEKLLVLGFYTLTIRWVLAFLNKMIRKNNARLTRSKLGKVMVNNAPQIN